MEENVTTDNTQKQVTVQPTLSTSQPTPPTEPVNTPVYKRKIVLVLFVLLTLLGILGVMFFILSRKTQPVIVKTIQPETIQKVKTIQAPTFNAEIYTYSGILPVPPPTLSTYSLKSNLTKEDAMDIAQIFNLETVSVDTVSQMILASSETPTYRGILTVSPKSGTFSYQSYGAFIPTTYKPGQTPTAEVTEFLNLQELLDSTGQCNVTYKDNFYPDVTFVECHRMWDKLGAPLVNMGGVLNIPENIQLTSLTPGKVSKETTALNPSITNVSNGGDGLERPNQFNTITVGVFPDGRIFSVSSTMRTVLKTQELNTSQLMTPQEALKSFQNNMGEISLTVPAGNGSVDLNKVYPGNTANAKIATITEITPAYLDKPLTEGQTEYTPYYLIRGTAMLTSGYTVAFTKVLPAEKVKAAKIASDSLQLNTFTVPQQATTPTTSAATPTITLTPTPAIGTKYTSCQQFTGALQPINLNVPGYGVLKMGVDLSNNNNSHAYYFMSEIGFLTSSTQLVTLKTAFLKAIEEQYVILAARALRGHYPLTPTNIGANPGKTYTDTEIINSIKPVLANNPLPNPQQDCNSAQDHLDCFQIDVANSMANRIVTRMNQLKNNPVELQATAEKPNLFPEVTIWNLNWVFYNKGGNTGYSPFANAHVGTVACYISGLSPHIFIHSKDYKTVSITTGAKLTYSDPAANSNVWEGNIKDDIFTNSQNVSRSSIYYEYNPAKINFTQDNHGFVTDVKDISSLVLDLGNKLGLRDEEKQALLSDTVNTLVNLPDTKYVKVSVIHEDEINKQLPLSILPKPTTISRFHLMLSPAKSGDKASAPTLKQITRSDYSVLELGAYAER